MKYRFGFAILAGMVALCFLATEADAFSWRRSAAVGGPGYYPYYGAASPYYGYDGPAYYPYGGPGYYFNPYVAPLPAYGILPPDIPRVKVGTADDPYKRTAGRIDRSAPSAPDMRVRFEIQVPYTDATVTLNGVATRQTGLTRAFVTPALEEGQSVPVTIEVRWRKQDGSMSAPRTATYTVTPGQTIRHTFKD
jgi:uncharacterized protein (TIGR03000 family)